MDDGLQAVTDADGRYHLAAIVPGDRAIKLAKHTLPPGSTLTTDETRIVPSRRASLIKIDWGVRVPAPEPPLAAPAGLPPSLPELRLTDAGGLVYRLAGTVVVGARVTVDGHAGARRQDRRLVRSTSPCAAGRTASRRSPSGPTAASSSPRATSSGSSAPRAARSSCRATRSRA